MDSDIPIPDQTKLEKRFAFIEDETQRTNTVIIFRYIIFLINLAGHHKLPGPMLYSLYKDIIIQTAIVTESCTHYALKHLIDLDKIKSEDVMEPEWKEEKCVILEEFDDGNRQVCGVVRHRTTERLTRNTQLIALNRACLRTGIFTDKVFGEAEKLRESRNKIHLAGLSNVDELYEQKDVDDHFERARIVIERIEKVLNDFKKI